MWPGSDWRCRRGALVAILHLKVRTACQPACLEGILQRLDAGAIAGVALGPRHEVVGQPLVTVGIQTQVDADLLHGLAHQKHFGRALQAGLLPLAVQIGAGGIGAQVAAHGAVGVHVGHHMEHALAQQHSGHRIVRVQQALQKAFDKPLRHGLTGMLTRDQPNLAALRQRCRRRCIGDAQQHHVAALQSGAQALQLHVRRQRRGADQIQMALVGIGFEIGEVDAIGVRREARGHDLPVEIGVDAKPVLAVVAGDHPVVVPAFRVGTLSRVQEPQGDRQLRRAVQAEMKPLGELAGVVAPDVELDVGRIGQAQHLDGAGIKAIGNVKTGHEVLPDAWRDRPLALSSTDCRMSAVHLAGQTRAWYGVSRARVAAALPGPAGVRG